MSLRQTNNVYKPFKYPAAVEFWRKHEKMHWLVDEVELTDDVKDWNTKLSDKEKLLCSTIFRFFTQGDILVADAYADKLIPYFGKQHEIKRLMLSNGGREPIHIDAYAKLMETVGMEDKEFSSFMNYKQMANKVDYLMSFDPNMSDPDSVESKKIAAKTLAVYSAFMEGMQLFSSFAILLNFSRFGKMKGMATIIEWSIRDELMHCESMTWIFRTFIKENPEIWTDEFKKEIYQICRDMVKLEDAFIDLVFKEVEIEGLTAEEVKKYIRFVADRRLADLGLKANYHIKENPLPWMSWMIMPSHDNFFEKKPTEYSKAANNDWSDVF